MRHSPTPPRSELLTYNNFDLLRLLLALVVCLVHSSQLSGFKELEHLFDAWFSIAAVKAFFVISGFLIVMSYERSASLQSYFSKRLRRIYPAYVVVVLVPAIALVLLSSQDPLVYFSREWLKYVIVNLFFLNFLQLSLPGVFDKHVLTAVNGALWTLKIEVMFYALVPLLVWLCRKFSYVPVIIIFYGLSLTYASYYQNLAAVSGDVLYLEISRQLPGQLVYFLSGSFLYYHLALFERYSIYALMTALLLLGLNQYYPLSFIEPFVFAVVVVYLGLFGYLGNVGKYGDFSYGVYILHYPIFQVLLEFTPFKQNPWMFLLTGLVLVFIGAIMLWHGVEKRFLMRASHYVVVSA